MSRLSPFRSRRARRRFVREAYAEMARARMNLARDLAVGVVAERADQAGKAELQSGEPLLDRELHPREPKASPGGGQ